MDAVLSLMFGILGKLNCFYYLYIKKPWIKTILTTIIGPEFN